MLDRLLGIIAPHPCIYCGAAGFAICENCKYDIELITLPSCLLCHEILYNRQCQAQACKLFGVVQFVASEREGELAELLSAYKFSPARAHSRVIAELLDAFAPHLPFEVKIVPIPTSSAHIRQRGFDHTLRLGRDFARRRGYKLAPVLARQHNRRQVGSTRVERFKNARTAYVCSKSLSVTHTYVVLDDVTTTGATLLYAYEALKQAGARNVMLVAVSHQTLH